MFGFIGIALMIAGAGLIQKSILLGVLAWVGAFAAMSIGERYPWIEERLWGAFWMIAVLAIPIGWVMIVLGF